MAGDIIWQGGASTTAQVNTGTFAGGWATGTTATTTLTMENGSSTQTVVSTVGATETIEAARDLHLAALQADTQSLFRRFTFAASSTDKIIYTTKAAYAGIPTAITASETAAGTFTMATTTPNSGPNDVGTAANYNTAAIPVTDDELQIMPHPSDEDSVGAPKS